MLGQKLGHEVKSLNHSTGGSVERLQGNHCPLVEGCFMPLSTVFQSYQCDSSHYSCLSLVSSVLGRALKCLAKGHSHEKTQRIQCGSNPGPLDYKSKTLPLSHADPWKGVEGAIPDCLLQIIFQAFHTDRYYKYFFHCIINWTVTLK